MVETLKLPTEGRSPTFSAQLVLTDKGESIEVVEDDIIAPRRGSEIMEIIMTELQQIASSRNKPVIHIFEATTHKAKELIKKYPDYIWTGKSSTHDPLYERTYNP